MSPASRKGKVGLRRVDAAIDAMLQYGFPRRFIKDTISELLKVYGAEGWVFIEDCSYRLLVETLLQKQEESEGNCSPKSLHGGERSGVDGDSTPVAGCSTDPLEPEGTEMTSVKVASPSIHTDEDHLLMVKMDEVSRVGITAGVDPRSSTIVYASAQSYTQTYPDIDDLIGTTTDLKKVCGENEKYGVIAKNDYLIKKMSPENGQIQVRCLKKEQREGKDIAADNEGYDARRLNHMIRAGESLAGNTCSKKPLLERANTFIKPKTKQDNPSLAADLSSKRVISTVFEKDDRTGSRSCTEKTIFSEATDVKVKKEAELECGKVEGKNDPRSMNKVVLSKDGGSATAAHTVNRMPSKLNVTIPVMQANDKVKREQVDTNGMNFRPGIDIKPTGREAKKEVGFDCGMVEGGYGKREMNNVLVSEDGISTMAAHTVDRIIPPVNVSNTCRQASTNKVKNEQMECGGVNFSDTCRQASTNKVKNEQMECGGVNSLASIDGRQTGREDDLVAGVCDEKNLFPQFNAHKKREQTSLNVEPAIDGHTRRGWERTKITVKQDQRVADRVEIKTESYPTRFSGTEGNIEQRRSRWDRGPARMECSQRRSDETLVNMGPNLRDGMMPADIESRRWGSNLVEPKIELGSRVQSLIVADIEHGRRDYDVMATGIEHGRAGRHGIAANIEHGRRGYGISASMEHGRRGCDGMAAKMDHGRTGYDGMSADVENGLRWWDITETDFEHSRRRSDRIEADFEHGRRGQDMMMAYFEQGPMGWDGAEAIRDLSQREWTDMEATGEVCRRRRDREGAHEEDGRARTVMERKADNGRRGLCKKETDIEYDFKHTDNSFRKSYDSFSRGAGLDGTRSRSNPSQKQRNGEPVPKSTVINQGTGRTVKSEGANWDDKLSAEGRDLAYNVTVNNGDSSGWGSWGEKKVNLRLKKEGIGSNGVVAVAPNSGLPQTDCEFVRKGGNSDVRMTPAINTISGFNEDKNNGHDCGLLLPEKKQDQKPAQGSHPPHPEKRVRREPEPEGPVLPPGSTRDRDDDVAHGGGREGKEKKGAAARQCRGWISRPPYPGPEEQETPPSPPPGFNGEETRKKKTERNEKRRPCHGWIGQGEDSELVQSLLKEQLRDMVQGTACKRLKKRGVI